MQKIRNPLNSHASPLTLSEALSRIQYLEKIQIPLEMDTFANEVEALTDSYMLYLGYSEEEITKIKRAPRHTPLCELQEYGWLCDDGETSYHPDKDTYEEHAEMIRWVLDELGDRAQKRLE